MMVMMRFNRRILLWSSDRLLQREGVFREDVSNKNGDKIKRSSPLVFEYKKKALYSLFFDIRV